jgi:hypothetical protein
LSFSIKSPWQVKGSHLILGMDRQLWEMWSRENRDQWALLRQICQLPGVLDKL